MASRTEADSSRSSSPTRSRICAREGVAVKRRVRWLEATPARSVVQAPVVRESLEPSQMPEDAFEPLLILEEGLDDRLRFEADR